MDDLRRRFAGLDQVPAPDLWGQIESRAAASPSTVVKMTPVALTGSVQPRGVGGRSLALLGAAALLLVALAVGVVAVGSGVIQLAATDASVDPSAVPTASTAPTATESAAPVPTTAGLVAYTRSLDPETGKETCPDRVSTSRASSTGSGSRTLTARTPASCCPTSPAIRRSWRGHRMERGCCTRTNAGAIALVDPSGTERRVLGDLRHASAGRDARTSTASPSPPTGLGSAFAAGRASDGGRLVHHRDPRSRLRVG